MKNYIRRQFRLVKDSEEILLDHVQGLENDMNECECDSKQQYDFRNVLPVEENSILCLNCGGYIEYKEEDWL